MPHPTVARHAVALLPFSVLAVPPGPAPWWAHLRLATEPAEPDATPEPQVQPQPTAEIQAQAPDPLPVNSLRIGTYIIGEANCQELYGHPDIRY